MEPDVNDFIVLLFKRYVSFDWLLLKDFRDPCAIRFGLVVRPPWRICCG